VTGADELTWAEYRDLLTLETTADRLAKKECFPGSLVPVVQERTDSQEGGGAQQGVEAQEGVGSQKGGGSQEVGGKPRILVEMQWGLEPSAGQQKRGVGLIFNLRDDRLHRTYPQLLRTQRCLLPAAGFYEWQKAAKPQKGKKPGFRFRLTDHPLFSFAGVWRRSPRRRRAGSADPDRAEMVTTCSLITTTPNEQVAPIHQRMPVILLGDEANQWLCADADICDLQALLRPCRQEMIIEPLAAPGKPKGGSQLSLF
jgi:putative SOS response-associated peptidase YedK